MKMIYFLMIIGLSSCNYKIQNDRQSDLTTDSINYHRIKNKSEYWVFTDFIIKYPDTKFFYKALSEYHKKRDAYFDLNGWPISDCFSNCASIKIRPNQEIIFEHNRIKINQLHDSLLVFLINENFSELKPEKKEVEDYNGHIQLVSRGYIELAYVKDSCDNLRPIIKEISKSISSYKNHLSKNWYGKELKNINKEVKQHLDSAFQCHISLYEFDKEYLPPPPPPATDNAILRIVEN